MQFHFRMKDTFLFLRFEDYNYMSKFFDRYQKRRLLSSYFSVVLVIAMVLFLLGVLGLLVINTHKIANHYKEQMAITLFLKEGTKEIEITQLQKSLSMAAYTKNTLFISKETAAEKHSKAIGEDFLTFLGHNPLQDAIDLYLKASYVTPDSIQKIANTVSKKSFIADVVYDKPLIELLNENVKRIGFWILVSCGVFTMIAVLLINSSIRLSVHSKRFVIKTMQMVGATKKFIRSPFILNNIKLGIIGAFIATLLLGLLLYYFHVNIPELQLLSDPLLLAGLFVGIFIIGILITWISTYFVTQRFLNLRTDDLYY